MKSYLIKVFFVLAIIIAVGAAVGVFHRVNPPINFPVESSAATSSLEIATPAATQPSEVSAGATQPPAPAYVDPSLKIARCKAAKEYKLNAYIDSMNRQLQARAYKLDQERLQKNAAFAASVLPPATSTNGGSLSASTQAEVMAAALQGAAQTIQFEAQINLNEFNREYVDLQNQYQQMLDDYSQSLQADYMQCLNQ